MALFPSMSSDALADAYLTDAGIKMKFDAGKQVYLVVVENHPPLTHFSPRSSVKNILPQPQPAPSRNLASICWTGAECYYEVAVLNESQVERIFLSKAKDLGMKSVFLRFNEEGSEMQKAFLVDFDGLEARGLSMPTILGMRRLKMSHAVNVIHCEEHLQPEMQIHES